MGLDWFLFGFIFSSWLHINTVLCGIFLIWAWVDVVASKFQTRSALDVPSALYLFSIAVLLGPIASWAASMELTTEEKAALMWCFVLINLVLLLATRAIMRGRSGPGTKLVAIGVRRTFLIARRFFTHQSPTHNSI